MTPPESATSEATQSRSVSTCLDTEHGGSEPQRSELYADAGVKRFEAREGVNKEISRLLSERESPEALEEMLEAEIERLGETVHLLHFNEHDFKGDCGFTQIVFERHNGSEHSNRMAAQYRLPPNVIIELIQLLAALNYVPSKRVEGKALSWRPETESRVAEDFEFNPQNYPGHQARQETPVDPREAAGLIHEFLTELSEVLEFDRYQEEYERETGNPFNYDDLFPREFFGKCTLYDFPANIAKQDLKTTLRNWLAHFKAKKKMAQSNLQLMYRMLPPSGVHLWHDPAGGRNKVQFPVDLNREICRIEIDGQEHPVYITIGNGYADTEMLLMFSINHPQCPVYAVGVRFEQGGNGEPMALVNTIQLKTKNMNSELELAEGEEPILKRPSERIQKEIIPKIEAVLKGAIKYYLLHAIKAIADQSGIKMNADHPSNNMWVTGHQAGAGLSSETIRHYDETYVRAGAKPVDGGYEMNGNPLDPKNLERQHGSGEIKVRLSGELPPGIGKIEALTHLSGLHYSPGIVKEVNRIAISILGLEYNSQRDSSIKRFSLVAGAVRKWCLGALEELITELVSVGGLDIIASNLLKEPDVESFIELVDSISSTDEDRLKNGVLMLLIGESRAKLRELESEIRRSETSKERKQMIGGEKQGIVPLVRYLLAAILSSTGMHEVEGELAVVRRHLQERIAAERKSSQLKGHDHKEKRVRVQGEVETKKGVVDALTRSMTAPLNIRRAATAIADTMSLGEQIELLESGNAKLNITPRRLIQSLRQPGS